MQPRSKFTICSILVVIVALFQPTTTEYVEGLSGFGIRDFKNGSYKINEGFHNFTDSKTKVLKNEYSELLFINWPEGNSGPVIYTFYHNNNNSPCPTDSHSSLKLFLLVAIGLLNLGFVFWMVLQCLMKRSNKKHNNNIPKYIRPSHLIVPDKTLNV